MDREDMQHLVEEIQSLYLQSAEASDCEDYGAARSLAQRGDVLQKQLNDAGYELEDDPGDIELIHVLRSGKRYAAFHLADWQWKEVLSE